jgi:uncharacterized membrane protein required for colicin V production
VNELDIILVFIVLVGVGVGYRRGLVRVFISTVGIYFTVVVAGYVYRPVGDTISGGLDRLGIGVGQIGAHNFSYIVAVIAMTIVVELVSRSTFELTRIRAVGRLDNVLGAVLGIFYGALWASLFLLPGQYSVAVSNSSWRPALNQSELMPIFNSVFQNAVLDVVSFLFIDGVPLLFLNSESSRVSALLPMLASLSGLRL